MVVSLYKYPCTNQYIVKDDFCELTNQIRVKTVIYRRGYVPSLFLSRKYG